VAVAKKLAPRVESPARPLAEILALASDCSGIWWRRRTWLVRINDQLLDRSRARSSEHTTRAAVSSAAGRARRARHRARDCRIEWADGGIKARQARRRRP